MSSISEPVESLKIGQSQPHLIFSTELEGVALLHILQQEHVLEELVRQQYGIALAMIRFTDEQAAVVRLLNAHQIYVVAWLLLPPEEGYWFNLQNYPQAVQHYHAFRGWAVMHQIHVHAIGLDVEPPVQEVATMSSWGLRDIARRLWLARENVLYPAARSAYKDLIADIHHDGYEVHVFQLPLVADDRRAGTNLLQRAIDVVDLPADLEVLICPSSLSISRLNNDLGGALITSYGPAADSIGVGNTNPHTILDEPENAYANAPSLTWKALERDLLLAERYTDTIYVFSLEGCIERGLLPRIADLNWGDEPRWPLFPRVIVSGLRMLLLVLLLFGRFYQTMFAWLGWIVAIVLLVQRWRTARRARRGTPETRE